MNGWMDGWPLYISIWLAYSFTSEYFWIKLNATRLVSTCLTGSKWAYRTLHNFENGVEAEKLPYQLEKREWIIKWINYVDILVCTTRYMDVWMWSTQCIFNEKTLTLIWRQWQVKFEACIFFHKFSALYCVFGTKLKMSSQIIGSFVFSV